MNNKRIIIGVTIGIIAAILWSVVFINVLNSTAGIGIGICLGISFGISGSLIFSKKDKDKWWYNFQFANLSFEKRILQKKCSLCSQARKFLWIYGVITAWWKQWLTASEKMWQTNIKPDEVHICDWDNYLWDYLLDCYKNLMKRPFKKQLI